MSESFLYGHSLSVTHPLFYCIDEYPDPKVPAGSLKPGTKRHRENLSYDAKMSQYEKCYQTTATIPPIQICSQFTVFSASEKRFSGVYLVVKIACAKSVPNLVDKLEANWNANRKQM